MNTPCSNKAAGLERHGRRRVELDFDGGSITSDAGILLLQELEGRLGQAMFRKAVTRIGQNPARG